MTGRSVDRARPSVRKMAIASVCLFGAAGLMWTLLPTSEAGGYGESSGGADGLDAVGKAVPVQGSMTVQVAGERAGGMDGAGDARMVERLARDMAGNWLNGTITDAEFFGAMSYLYGEGYLEVVGKDGLGAYGVGLDGAVDGTVDGPAGSSQGWCKDGLVQRTNAFTGDMVCVPDGYADGEAGARWIEPVGGSGGVGDGDGGDRRGAYAGKGAGYETGSPEEVTWQWRPMQDGGSYVGGGQAEPYASDLKEKIADLENVNEGLLRTVAKLQEALMEVHMQGGAVGGGSGGDAVDIGGQGETAKHTMTVNLSSAASAAAGNGDGICLHGTDATFTSVIDPAMLSETGGSLGAIPMPDGRYTVLLMAASSTPVSVGIELAGDGGLAYDRTFTLEDTGRPPGEEATMWDYNSGVAEIVVDRAQVVNATAVVDGGDGMAVFAALARCR